MVKLTFLGSGAAFTMTNWQSNMLLESNAGKKLLIDCGGDVRHSLAEAGYGVQDIDGVYISHLHNDHIGGLEWLAFCTYFNPTLKKPKLFINGKMVDPLWESLKGGLGSIQGKIVHLADYFDVVPIGKNEKFQWGSDDLESDDMLEFCPVQVIHFMDGFDVVPSYGLLFNVDDVHYFITTDAQHAPHQIQDFYNMSDVIFQDCETSPFPSGVHAHFNELIQLDDDTKAKMWLYHYQDGDLPDADGNGFKGFVQKGEVFTL